MDRSGAVDGDGDGDGDGNVDGDGDGFKLPERLQVLARLLTETLDA